jgi:hypothetical protein
MGEPERVPHRDVGVGDVAVGRRPRWKAVVVWWALSHVITSRKPLVLTRRGHPDVLVSETGSASNTRIGCGEEGGSVCREQLVAGRLAEPIGGTFVDYSPGSGFGCVDVVDGSFFGF